MAAMEFVAHFCRKMSDKSCCCSLVSDKVGMDGQLGANTRVPLPPQTWPIRHLERVNALGSLPFRSLPP